MEMTNIANGHANLKRSQKRITDLEVLGDLLLWQLVLFLGVEEQCRGPLDERINNTLSRAAPLYSRHRLVSILDDAFAVRQLASSQGC